MPPPFRRIAEEHASEAAFLWLRRQAAADAPHYDLHDLGRLDDRVEAQLDGLRVSGDLGWEACREALSWSEPGEFFAATAIGVERGALRPIAEILDATRGRPALLDAVAAALGWVDRQRVVPLLEGLLDPLCPPELRRLGISACVAHACDPGVALKEGVQQGDPRLRDEALDAIGALGRRDLLPELHWHTDGDDESARFVANRSALLLGDREAPDRLWTLVEQDSRYAVAAAALAVRGLAPGEAAARLIALAATPSRRAAAIVGAAALGDPATVPLLLEATADPALARLAGDAFGQITGARIEGPLEGAAPHGWQAGPSEEAADSSVRLDPDEARPWPAPAPLDRWWRAHRAALRPGERYLRGAPMTAERLTHALWTDRQTTRASVALELAVRDPDAPLRDVRAPAFAQLQRRDRPA